LISDYEIKDDGILFSLLASTSNDAAFNTLFAKSPDDESWQIAHQFHSDTSFLYVPKDEINGVVDYAANAEDINGLISDYGNVLKIRSIVKPKVLDLELNCTYYSSSKLCLLEWQMIDNDEVSDIYHSVSYSNTIEKKSLGRSRYKDGAIFSSSNIPTKITISSRSPDREYLPYIQEGCSVNADEVVRNDLQLKLKQYE